MSDQPKSDPGTEPTPPMPPANWAPAPLAGQRPTMSGPEAPLPQTSTPLGTATAPQVEIEAFAPPRSKLPLLVAVIAVVVIAALWAATNLWPGSPTAEATSSATSDSSATGTGSATATQSATPASSGQRFASEDGSISGTWEVLEHEWTSTGLEIKLRVSVDEGLLDASVAAYGYQQNQGTEPSASSHDEPFFGSGIQAGQEEIGWLHFAVPPGQCSIFLMDDTAGEQMSALTVSY